MDIASRVHYLLELLVWVHQLSSQRLYLLVFKDNVTVFENIGEVTVCAQVVGNTTGIGVGIPIMFSPRVLLQAGSNKT